MMNNFVAEDISARKIKIENAHSQIKFEVKEEPVSVGEWDTYPEQQQIRTDDDFEDDSPVREEGELLIADYDMSNVEIQEETVTETLFDDNTDIPDTPVQDEIFVSHSSRSESNAFIARSAIEIYNGELPNTETSSTEEDIFKFQCGECDYRSPNLVTMQHHLKTHVSETLYRCDVCEYSSTKLESLASHLQRHTDDTYVNVIENNYEIESSNLHHINTEELMCHECSYCFSDLADLEAHKLQHRDQMPFHCTKCNYCSTEQEAFNRHLKTHQDIKLYKCDECLFTTNLNYKLSAHMKLHTAQDVSMTSKSKNKRVDDIDASDDDNDEDWRPKSRVVVTDSRSTRQGFHDPALKRALKVSLTERRKMQKKRPYNKHKQISYSPETSSSWPSSPREEASEKRSYKPRKVTTAKQRLAKIMKIKHIPIYKR